MLKVRVRLIWLLLIALNTQPLFAQTKIETQIDSLLTQAFSNGSFNGNALVSKKDEVIYYKSFGYLDAAQDKKLTASTRFNIGSIYKEFSAVALMILVEEGKLSLEDQISTFIPSLPSWGKKIRIKHLLQYTSGLPNLNWGSIKSDSDILNDLINLDSLRFEPGTNYFYNNNDISVRQFVVENVTGMPFNAFVHRNLFDPLGMTNAITNPTNETADLAIAFSNTLENDKIESRFSGVIYVTALDLLKWDQSLRANQLITEESIKILSETFSSEQSALGNVEFTGNQWVSHLHNGESRNFEAMLYAHYLNNYTIILLGNNKNRKLFELTEAMITILER
jgi:CubicO group peptidase (beta-lactamase class C family)